MHIAVKYSEHEASFALLTGRNVLYFHFDKTV